jgi:hypothetical protein
MPPRSWAPHEGATRLFPMTRLFTTLFSETSPARRAEYDECLRRNLACAALDEICLLIEGESLAPPDSPKLRPRKIARRPHYSDYFTWIEEAAKPGDVSVIANSDIYFDNQLGLFKNWGLPERCVVALSRWDVAPDGSASLFDRNDSQDTWIVRGTVRGVHGDFPIGVPRCDNRILFEFQKAGFRVANPAFSIRTYHLHAGQRVEYSGPVLPHYVPAPYRYLFPHNLWTLPRTLWHNLRHPGCRVGWRLDRRRLARTVPARGWNKLVRLTGNAPAA